MATSLRNVYMAFSFIAMGGLLFGFIIGVNSGVVIEGQLICKAGDDAKAGTFTSFGYGQCYKLSSLMQGVVSSLNIIGATLASIFCFVYADTMGRKLEVQVGAAFYFLGALLAAVSPVLWGTIVGLGVYGLGVGFGMHAAPIYIAEISPPEVRGRLVSAKEAIIVFGMFLGFFTGFIFQHMKYEGWRYMMGFSAVVALVMLVGINFVPQSPRYLVLEAVKRGGLLGAEDGLLSQARKALVWFRAKDDQSVDTELQYMRSDAAAAVSERVASWTDTFKYPKPLVIGWGLVLLQQVTGQPSVLYYATNIFKAAGFSSPVTISGYVFSPAALSSMAVAFVKLLATLVTVSRIDQYGRRFLLFVGISMMTVALALLVPAFLFRTCTDGRPIQECPADDVTLPKGWAVCVLFALMLYVSGYQVGFGPISWTIISEIFPLSVRGAAMSTAAVVNFVSNTFMTMTQEVLTDAMTPSGVFSMYFVMCIVSLVFVWAVCPETKGKTLEQIQAEMTGASGEPFEPKARERPIAVA